MPPRRKACLLKLRDELDEVCQKGTEVFARNRRLMLTIISIHPELFQNYIPAVGLSKSLGESLRTMASSR